MNKYKVVDFIVDFLEYKQINTIFTVTGGGSIFINDALSKSKKIQSIAHHHEQAAAIAAEGFARLSSKIGVCVVTSGPGGTNAITGVLCAYQDSIPVFYISGNVRKELTTNYTKLDYRQLGDQEFDISKFVEPITKKSIQLNSTENLIDILEDLYHTATNDRPGPVWLDIPLDIQKTLINKFNPNYNVDKKLIINNFKLTDTFISLLNNSKKPLFILGNGIRLSNSLEALYEVLNLLNIPSVLSFNGIDLIDSDHNLNFGRIGIVGNIHANKIVQESDLIIALGTRLYVRQIGYNLNSFAKNAQIIHIDVDMNELNKTTVRSDLKICIDAAVFLSSLLENIKSKKIDLQNTNDWLKRCNNIKNSNPIFLKRHMINKPISPIGFLCNFSLKCPIKYSYVLSDGTANVTGSQVIQLKLGQRLFTNKATAPMGYGLPAAIGASFVNNNIICIEGDGSIQMNIQELQTVVQNNLNIKIIILNNNGYLSIKITQKNLCEGNLHLSSPISGLTLPNYKKIANAFGIKYYSLDNLEQLDDILTSLFEKTEPAILEVFLDEEAVHEPKIVTKIDNDGNFTNPEFDDIEWLS